MIPLDLTVNERASLLHDNQVTFYRDCVPSAPEDATDSRIIGPGPEFSWVWQAGDGSTLGEPFKCPYGQHGQILDLNGVTAILAEPFPFIYGCYSLWRLILYLPNSVGTLEA